MVTFKNYGVISGYDVFVIDHLVNTHIRQGSVTITVRVHPSANRTILKEVLADGSVKIDVAAAPEKGKANRELIRFLAGAFGVPKSSIEILCGEMSGMKMVRVKNSKFQ